VEEPVSASTTPTIVDDARSTTLRHWEEFCERLLPASLLRLARWKGLEPPVVLQGLDDVRQELAVDCLANAEALARLPVRTLRQRWLKQAGRYAYDYLLPRWSSLPSADDPRLPTTLPAGLPMQLHGPGLAAMSNGRANVAATASDRGTGVRSVRRQLLEVAERLDRGASYRQFWRRRTAEALIGLAVDLLRDQAPLVLVPRARSRPDPRRRRRRLQMLVARFLVQPATMPERTRLRRWCRTKRLDSRSARSLLQDALELMPEASSGWLWLFEACFVESDLRAAAAALRQGRQLAVLPGLAMVLARARLLEARDRWPAAQALLRRAAARRPRDAILPQLASEFTSRS
jgi:hypothetical protein